MSTNVLKLKVADAEVSLEASLGYALGTKRQVCSYTWSEDLEQSDL